MDAKFKHPMKYVGYVEFKKKMTAGEWWEVGRVRWVGDFIFENNATLWLHLSSLAGKPT